MSTTQATRQLAKLSTSSSSNNNTPIYDDYDNQLFDQYTNLGIEFVSLLSDKDNNKDRLISIDREMVRIKDMLSGKCILWVS